MWYRSNMGEAGFGRAEITVYEPDMAMLGWGVPDQHVEHVGAPLAARALVLRDAGRLRALVVADLCFISAALRARVFDELKRAGVALRDADLMLLATHTHSGPNGYHHALFYDLSAPGLSERVLSGLAVGIARSVVHGVQRLEPALLSLGRDRLEPDVAFNRAAAAHRENPEVAGSPSPRDAVDRTVRLLRVDARSGAPLGAVVCFGLHATSVHAEHHVLHPDHKGLAATAFEQAFRSRSRTTNEDSPFVALFVQGAAGDVSPNHRFDGARGVTVGRYDDDFESARHVADAEVRAALRAFESPAALTDNRHSTLARVDFERRPVSDAFAPPGARTTEARLGVAMAMGTQEGPGPLAPLRRLVEAA